MRAHACRSRDGELFRCAACDWLGDLQGAIVHVVEWQWVMP